MDTSTWINIYRYPETLKHMAHPVPDIKIPKITPKQ